MSKLLDKISSPIDVHKFSNKELTILRRYKSLITIKLKN